MPDAAPAPAASAAPATTPAASAPASTTTPAVSTTPGVDPGAWRSGLSPEYLTNPSLAKFTDVNGFVKSYLDQEKAIMAPKLPLPQATWGEKEWGDFYGKIGRPEKPDGYGFLPVENLPAGLTASPEQDAWFAEKAHKLGLTKAQGTALREDFVKYQIEKATGSAAATQADLQKREADTLKLQASFGTKWTAAIDGAQKVVATYGSPEFKELMKSSGLDSHPAVLDFMTKISGILSDHSVIKGTGGATFGTSPAAAASEITRMNADPTTAAIIANGQHPRHDAVMAQRAQLYKVAYGA